LKKKVYKNRKFHLAGERFKKEQKRALTGGMNQRGGPLPRSFMCKRKTLQRKEIGRKRRGFGNGVGRDRVRGTGESFKEEGGGWKKDALWKIRRNVHVGTLRKENVFLTTRREAGVR